MEDDVYVLRGIGINEEYISEYGELHTKTIRAFTVIMTAGVVITPLFLIPTYYLINHRESLFLDTLYILLIPIVLGGGYFQFVMLKVTRRYAKLIERTWTIRAGGNILNEKKLLILMNIGAAEGICLMFALWVLTGDILSLVFAVLLLILPPSINFVAKEKIGYTLNRLFRGDVDQIAEKLAIMLNGKKKLLIRSQNSRKYEIEFGNPYKFRVSVSRRPDKRSLVEISVMGVKPENVSEAKRLILRIEKTTE